MPNKLKVKSCILSLVSSVVPAMFLVCKFQEYKRQQQEQNKRKTAERELSNLNHKIDKLLIKLEEHEPELAASPDDECVICISAKATMQTFPCGHRVVCRKCFVKTIQVAVSQRLLPLRCVICRAKILRLKQTTHGGIDTGTVLRSRGAIASSSSSASSSNVPNNPFYLSPATSPVSPVTEVFREQRAVWVRNYDSFGYTSAGQSPSITPTTPVSPLTSTASAATPTTPPEGLAKTDQSLRSGCVLHKHCFGKHKLRNNSPNVSPITQSPSSSFSSTSSSSSSSPSTAVKTPITSLLSSIQTGATASSGLHSKPVNKLSTTPTHHHRCTSNPWQWQFNRKKRHRLAHRRRHGNHFGGAGRPNSLLLPIDERDEFQDILSGRASQASDRENGKNNGIKCQKSATIAEPEDFDDTRMPEDSAVVTDSDQYENVSPKDEARAMLPSGGALRLSSSDTQMDKLSSDEESESVKSYESAKNISRKSSVSGLLSPPRRKPMKNGSISLTLASSKIGTTFLKAKNLMSRGKWSIY